MSKGFPKTNNVTSFSKLFRTGRTKINFQFHDKSTVHILPFSMFCSRTSKNLINKTHECFLRPILNDNESSFVEVLRENNDIANPHRNIQIDFTKVLKTIKNLARPVIEDLFNARPNDYNLRKF